MENWVHRGRALGVSVPGELSRLDVILKAVTVVL